MCSKNFVKEDDYEKLICFKGWKFNCLRFFQNIYFPFLCYALAMYPAGIWCQNDVVSTSMRRDHVASTLTQRHFYAMCPLSSYLLYAYEKRKRFDNDSHFISVWGTWGSWTFCSATCGTGQISRRRQCQIDYNIVHDDTCLGEAPSQVSRCTVNACPRKFLGGGRVVRWCWVNFQCRGVLQFGLQ